MKKVSSLSEESIINKIYVIRGLKVLIDSDLAELYCVETRRLKEQVKRNIRRFPEDFMFAINQEELKCLRSQIATSNRGLISDPLSSHHPSIEFMVSHSLRATGIVFDCTADTTKKRVQGKT
jgi:hypothetical protein